jgi:hypothetical protein
MVILPLFFKLYSFAPAFSKRREPMPLFCEEELTVSNLLRKDRIALVNLTLILSSLQFYPCFGKKNGQHVDTFFHTLTYIASDFDKKWTTL